MSIRARMKVDSVTDYGSHKTVKLSPVTTGDQTSPNYSYSKWTPSGSLELVITNPDAYNQFTPQKVFDIDFNEYIPEVKTNVK